MRTHVLRPQITIGDADYRKLVSLAMAVPAAADDGDDLFSELERARVVTQAKLARDVVRMGSSVTFRADTGTERAVTLVYPADADISAGKISVLTPIGTALIGLRVGQSITWTARDGQRHVLTLLSAAPPVGAEA